MTASPIKSAEHGGDRAKEGSTQKPVPNHTLTDGADRACSKGPRTCLAEEFLREWQDDMLTIVEEWRELRRSRKEGPNPRPVPNYGSPRGLTRLPGAASKSAQARTTKEKQ